VRVDVGIHADLGTVLRQINPGVTKRNHSAWLGKISDWQEESSTRDILQQKNSTLLAAQAIHAIWEGTDGKAVVVSDVGQHQMLEAQYYRHDEPYTLLTSGGLGTMGFSLPAAIGASFHVKDREVWAIAGDGSIQMNIQELGTAVQENANIKIAIMNNGYLGMVRQWQQLFFEARYVETPITSPDYVKLAEAYGMPGFRVHKYEDVIPTVRKAQAHNGPVLMEFVVEQHDMVYPMVPAGADLHAMLRRPHPQFEE
jgi:acetolactate synthase-1/2/3 large subunit